MTPQKILALALMLAAAGAAAAQTATPIPVNTDNFVRAESDVYMGNIVADGGFGKFEHARNFPALDKQLIIRLNRDTLYSYAVVDLDASPATLVMPNAGTRYMAAQIVNQDHITVGLWHDPGRHVLTREEAGTRYALIIIRTLVDETSAADMKRAHQLQDALAIEQANTGRFEIPAWDKTSHDQVRKLLLGLVARIPDYKRMFGSREQIEPVRHLLGTAAGWGGNPESEAIYAGGAVANNDGKAVYRVHVQDVPMKAFWSLSVYNADGYFEPNPLKRYSVNSVTAHRQADGSIDVQFGGCAPTTPNCIPTMAGWNYLVRIYRPEASVLDGRWTFPVPVAVATP
ncbi:DUF1214 domain-containing protein [Stenotrophomonas sp. 24(2023)]|uniref:DUF1214 domain-containing protein n=1 Tax=Stenotrophomonas sp. 24(2023) TaxID=3068324 RepID=UPI0027DF531A|nr:DUF1214 domain-containing protein [Stenotrophomonas sp. 24(2023)]WMJ71220.1 DUF1214 domain-containing protein [Stenotrophomonas sp. 24(2023)]